MKMKRLGKDYSEMNGRRSQKAVTLVELLITVAIIIAGAYLLVNATDLVRKMLRQHLIQESHMESQSLLYRMTKDVRNANKIVVLTPNQLSLRSYNTANGYDVRINPNLLTDANTATTTYRYMNASNPSFIQRDFFFANSTSTQKFLVDKLSLYDDDYQIFRITGGVAADPKAVQITFRFKSYLLQKSSNTYSVNVALRS